MRVLLLHAYSRRNRGDGLLVDETIGLLQRAFGPGTEVTVVASDASSFGDLEQVVQVPGLGRPRHWPSLVALSGQLAGRLAQLPGRYRFLDAASRGATLVVGVGGGYLRTGSPAATAKMALTHLPQLDWAAACGLPAVYLPQSVGPLAGPPAGWVRDRLRQVAHVCVRDDRSGEALSRLPNVIRVPDLAVLAVAREYATVPRRTPEKLYVVARDLPLGDRRAGYMERLRGLRKILPTLEPVVQSDGGGNDDPAFYDSLGWHGPYRSAHAIGSEPGIVVSVRLHGSLGAILAGMPSVHLAYERKGYGAYGDLGLTGFLARASDFCPIQVADTVRTLQSDQRSFWSCVETRVPAIARAERELVNLVRASAGVYAA